VRVLFTAHGAYGHVLALMGVARALADDGHDVLVATASPLCTLVSSHGLHAEAAGMDDEALVAEARRRWPETEGASPRRSVGSAPRLRGVWDGAASS
jgi:UDP:flavonoid glycosyltransferase YjiC (YdhE family)